MLHVERLLELRELRAIVNVRCLCIGLRVASMDGGVRGARTSLELASWCGGVERTPGI